MLTTYAMLLLLFLRGGGGGEEGEKRARLKNELKYELSSEI